MAKDNFIKTIWLSVDVRNISPMADSEFAHKLEFLEDTNRINYKIYPFHKTGAKNSYVKVEVNSNHYNEVMKDLKYYTNYEAIKILSAKPASIKD
jgi:hypothetical protein